MPRFESLNPEYKLSDLDTTGISQYYGYVDSKGAWYIMRLTDTEARYIKGSSNYSASWDNRAYLAYDYYHVIF